MGITKEERERRERKRRDAAWEAERLRVQALEDAFGAVPASPAKAVLIEVMTGRIIDLYNNTQFEHGDILLEFLPRPYAMALLEWYFDDEDPNSVFTPPPTPSADEAAQPWQVQGGPQAGGGPDGVCAGEAHAGQGGSISDLAAQPAGTNGDESRVADIVAIAGDLVALWQNPTIQGLPRAERNAAIEETRSRLIEAVGAHR